MQYLKERFASFSDLLADLLVDVLLADMSAPLSNNFLIYKIFLVQGHQDLGNHGQEIRVSKSNESLDASQK